MIVVVTGTPREVEAWAKRNALSPCDYIVVKRPSTLATFPRGTPYVTVGEWVAAWFEHGSARTLPRKHAYEMILAAECAGLRLARELAE